MTLSQAKCLVFERLAFNLVKSTSLYEPDCLEAARRLSELTYAKPGMHVTFYESARRA